MYAKKVKNDMEYIKNFFKYRGLIEELVGRDLKVKYRRSALGYVWTILSPLMMMIVMSIVFSFFFRYEIENYTVYLLTGQLLFNFYSEATNSAMSSIVSSRSLISKVHIPKYIFPMARVMSAFVNLLFSLVAIVIMLIVTKSQIYPTIFLFPISLFYLFIFTLGIGLILSVLAVFFRDIYHIYSVLVTALMYFTPIFYPTSALPDYAIRLIKLNPLYHIVTMFRACVIYGKFPTLNQNLICMGIGTLFLGTGLLLFKKNQDKFVMFI